MELLFGQHPYSVLGVEVDTYPLCYFENSFDFLSTRTQHVELVLATVAGMDPQ